MKKLRKINLASLSKEKLTKREQNRVVGGADCCACPCSGSSNAVEAAEYGLAGDIAWGYGIGKLS